MKKTFLLFTSLLMLTACGAGQETKPSTTSQESSASVSSKSSQVSSQVKEEKVSSTTSSEAGQSSLNLSQISQGNYQSLEGEWLAADGFSLVFTKSGLESTDYELGGFSLTDYGTASAGVYSLGEKDGFLVEVIPAGQALPDAEDSESGQVMTDDSKQDQDRIWVGTGLNGRGSVGRFLYKK